jgi:hypothetical protein
MFMIYVFYLFQIVEPISQMVKIGVGSVPRTDRLGNGPYIIDIKDISRFALYA